MPTQCGSGAHNDDWTLSEDPGGEITLTEDPGDDITLSEDPGDDITLTEDPGPQHLPCAGMGRSGNGLHSGGAARDVLVGGAGNDRLAGGLGRDMLVGGRGEDVFVFDTRPGPGNVDRVLDFKVADDTILMENAVFRGLTAGPLKAGAFWIGARAHDGDDRLVYDMSTGQLFYDADGTGSQAQVQIAQLTKNLKMTYADVCVI
jgi:Ca2+-binding RTX toxin-like protein